MPPPQGHNQTQTQGPTQTPKPEPLPKPELLPKPKPPQDPYSLGLPPDPPLSWPSDDGDKRQEPWDDEDPPYDIELQSPVLEDLPEGLWSRPRAHLAIVRIGDQYRPVVQGFRAGGPGFELQQACLLRQIGEEICKLLSSGRPNSSLDMTTIAATMAKDHPGQPGMRKSQISTWKSRISKIKNWTWVEMPDGTLRPLASFFKGVGRRCTLDLAVLREILSENPQLSIGKLTLKYCERKGIPPDRKDRRENVRKQIQRYLKRHPEGF